MPMLKSTFDNSPYLAQNTTHVFFRLTDPAKIDVDEIFDDVIGASQFLFGTIASWTRRSGQSFRAEVEMFLNDYFSLKFNGKGLIYSWEPISIHCEPNLFRWALGTLHRPS